jgi:hypothetical protein
VQAAKIADIVMLPYHSGAGAGPAEMDSETTAAKLVLRVGNQQASQFVSRGWLSRHNPQTGGYLVRFEDGRCSYAPAKAFEEGYTRL